MLAITQLAECLGTSERFVRTLVCERRISFHKVGKYVRSDQDDVDDGVAPRRVGAQL